MGRRHEKEEALEAWPERRAAATAPAEVEPEAEDEQSLEAEAAPEPAEAEEPEHEAVEVEPEAEVEAPAPQHAGGELDIPDDIAVVEGEPRGGMRPVAIVVSRFNGEITGRLLDRALEELDELGVARGGITVMPVPGAFELPLAAMALAKTRKYACVVALGCVIRGETPHFDYVAGEAASGLQLAALETGVPVAFGVLTTDTLEQAEARIEKAAEAVQSALEMADAFTQLRAAAARAQ